MPEGFSSERREEELPTLAEKGEGLCEHGNPKGSCSICGILEKELEEQEKERNNAPPGWLILSELSTKVGRGVEVIKKISEQYRHDHPEWFKKYQGLHVKREVEHYSPELIHIITTELNQYESAPEGWKTNKRLTTELKVVQSTVKKIADRYRFEKPESFKTYRGKDNQVSEFYSPELVSIINSQIDKRKKPSQDWFTMNVLTEELGRSERLIRKTAELYRLDHPEWFRSHERIVGDNYSSEYYSPLLVQKIRTELEKREEVPENWQTNSNLAILLGKTRDAVKIVADKYLEEHPEWVRDYENPKTGHIRQYYAPELVELIDLELSQKEKAPEGWLTRVALSSQLGKSFSATEKMANQYRSDHPEWFKFYSSKDRGFFVEHYDPLLVRLITEKVASQEDAPKGWMTRKAIAQEVKYDPKSIEKIASEFEMDHPDWFKSYIGRSRRYQVHFSPELVDRIKFEVQKRKEIKPNQKLENDLRQFIEEISKSETLSTEEFSDLVGFFGPSLATDILYKYHPEYRGLPVEYVDSILADYLGDFLTERHGFNLDNVNKIGQLTEEETSLQEGLFEMMKKDCLQRYNQNRDDGKEEVVQRIAEYKEKIGSSGDNILISIVNRIENYYENIFAMVLPDSMVSELRSGREFPDVNQRINIQEIKEKQRLLIADQMGLGKSASAIIAKEHLGCKTCLVVAPSNVIPTWENYLGAEEVVTDELGNRVNKGGYFKAGSTPKVLVIDSLEDIPKLSTDHYDYVVVAQEKLNQNYTDVLLGLDYDMLVTDEVHKLKNLKTGIRSNNLVQLAEKVEGDNRYLVMLSGTPIPNKVQDIALELKLLYPERFREVDEKVFAQQIIKGDILDLRALLLPRMQRKELATSIDMPKLSETVQPVELTGLEREIYELLLDEDELTATQKLQLLRKFLLNPEIVRPTPGFEGAKIEAAKTFLQGAFKDHRKVVMFVNGYIEGVIRGEGSIIDKLDLPADVKIKVIEGEVSTEERIAIQKELKESSGKILLVVSGQTADVGVDFSSGESVYFYNEPWTAFDKQQQLGRVYREGVKDDVEATTSIVAGTIEEGIERYLEIKQRAVEKLLLGVPTTELEKGLLQQDELVAEENREVNPELARYYFSSFDRMLRMFSYVKEMGEKDFLVFLEKFGQEYADCYLDIGGRSYQGNNSRAVATLFENIISERGQDKKALKILDCASGPEMLRRHSADDLRNNIISLDINRHHFEQVEGGKRSVGSLVNLPFASDSVDYCNLAFALHYTKFRPKRGDYERLEALTELHRVLKPGGRAMITLTHNLEFKDKQKFYDLVKDLGYNIVDQYSGQIESDNNYRSTVITLEKKVDDSSQDKIDIKKSDLLDGLKFRQNKDSKLRDPRHIIEKVSLNGRKYDVMFNQSDKEMLGEQKDYLQEGQSLIKQHGEIKNIPIPDIIKHNFVRILVRNKYLLFKKMRHGSGAVIIRD